MPNDLGFVEDVGFSPDEVGFQPNPEASPRARRRMALLGERIKAEQEGQAAEQDIADLEPQQRSIGFFADLPRHILNSPSYLADVVSRGMGGDAIPPTFAPGQSAIPVTPAHTGTGYQAGAEKLAADFLSSLTRPEMILAAPAAVESQMVRGLMGAQMSAPIPQQVERAAQVLGDINSTPAEKVVSVGEPVLGAAFTALLGHQPAGRPIPEAPPLYDLTADRIARNIAEPGTVRPQEIEAVGPIRHDVPPMFEAGDVPFQNMRRFGSYEVPAPDVLPRMGRIENVDFLEEPRPKQELETRGKVSFGAEAPTLLRTSQIPKAELEAIEAAQSVGLNRAAQEVTNASSEPSPAQPTQREIRPRMGEETPLRQPGETPGAREAQGAAEVQAQTPIAEAERIAGQPLDEFRQSKNLTRQAYELGEKVTTPQEIVRLKELELAAEKEANAAIDRADAGDESAFDTLGPLTARKQFFTEAIESAVGVARNKSKLSKVEIEKIKQAGVPAKGGESLAKEEITPQGEIPLVTRLEQIRDRFDATGDMGKTFSLPHPDAFKSIGRSIIYTALDIAINAVKAGRSLANAISLAMAHVSSAAKGFDPAQVQANLEHMVKSRTNVADLRDIYEIFQPEKSPRKTVGEKVSEVSEAFRTGFSSKFRPLNKLAEDVAKSYGHTGHHDVAGVFEQLKGSSGKAEADVYRFDQDVSKLVEGSEQDFNAYLFLRRAKDRLEQDAIDAAAGKPVRRKVSTYTLPDIEGKLATLEAKVGAKLPDFEKAADAYQAQMDQALQLQVDSGRMSPQVYADIKSGNQFYAPFKLLKYIEETMRPPGSGRRVQTQADYTKAMEGIEDPNVKLGELLPAARQNIVLSRILAEKNQAMRELSDLAIFDLNGTHIRRLAKGEEPPQGFETVTVLENGEPMDYAVNKNVAEAVQATGQSAQNTILQNFGTLFRAGATTFNLPFQVANILADQPRAALVSKYGIKGLADLVNYPVSFWKSLSAAIQGTVFGKHNQLYQDFLDSGAAGTTIQEYLTPERLTTRVENPITKGITSVLDKAGDFATAIEQTSKIVGIDRAMKEHGVTSGKELAENYPDAITEVRRFSGSPDFGRSGKYTDAYRLNLLYMFLNARIQGAVADVGRLAGRDGAKNSAMTWTRVGLAVGLPTVMAYIYNHMPGNKEDYEKRPQQEKQNYWLIPKDKYITASNGEKIRDYWRIPKREIAQWFGNGIESFLDFAQKRDPKSFAQFAQSTAENLSPVNIQGKNFQEKLESIGGSLNPVLKAPLELATGRDLYRHKNIVPDIQKKGSPENQFTDRTSDVFKKLAQAMPDVAPEVFRSPLMLENMTRNFTAGLLTQFIPGKPVEGRNAFENLPLMQRFQALPFEDSTDFEDRMARFEREAADTQLTRFRAAQKIFDDHKGASPQELVGYVVKDYKGDPKMAERVIDVWIAHQRGINSQERRILALPTEQRARFINDELQGKTPEQKASIIRDYAKKRILTEAVGREMTR